MKCVFCGGGSGHDGHTAVCPMNIETAWKPGTTPRDSTWLELARTLLIAWRQDTSVYDRGTAQDQGRLEELWRRMEKALDLGDPDLALALVFRHYNPEETSTPGRGRHGRPSL